MRIHNDILGPETHVIIIILLTNALPSNAQYPSARVGIESIGYGPSHYEIDHSTKYAKH